MTVSHCASAESVCLHVLRLGNGRSTLIAASISVQGEIDQRDLAGRILETQVP